MNDASLVYSKNIMDVVGRHLRIEFAFCRHLLQSLYFAKAILFLRGSLARVDNGYCDRVRHGHTFRVLRINLFHHHIGA